MRAPFQVLVFPFVKEQNEYLYAVFKRHDMSIWQAIAGGGEGEETALEAAKREAFEEASIDRNCNYIRLSATTTIPATNIHGLLWGDIIMIPEISFGVELPTREIKLSDEHKECQWLTCAEAMAILKYDSNKSAVWELDYRLKKNLEGTEENKKNILKYYA
ncbi:MAG: NUDIX domain-containing protein [Patescibacteria group bacterium]